MSHALKNSLKMTPMRVVGIIVVIAATAGMSVEAWSQSGRLGQRSTPASGLVTPSSAELVTFRTCLATTTDEADRAKCGDPIYDACNRDSGSPDTTSVISMCLISVDTAWDQSLNQLYRTILAAQTPTARASLRTAQRLWIASRDADCAAVYDANISGSIRSVAAASCRVNATRRRVEWLSGLGQP